MITLLSRWLIKDWQDYASPRVRLAYGMLCGVVGIVFNLLLTVGKVLAGFLTGSIAMTADGIHHLSDAASSLITLLGFKLAGKKPDLEHPFGHGRIEYVSGLVVAILIILMAFELGKTSIEKIITPEPVEFKWLSVVILLGSILVKVYMYIYNAAVSRKIGSAAMRATATDSLSDCIATFAVLLSIFAVRMFGWNVDGYAGAVVSVFVLIAGINVARDTLSPLLGQPPSGELVARIEQIVMSREEILGMHDLVVHDYGPGRLMISLHAEVPGDGDMHALHDIIDNIEEELACALSCEAVIHMDPVDGSEETVLMREKVCGLVDEIDPVLAIHDFRMVQGPTHVNVIFDVVVPFKYDRSDEQVMEAITDQIKALPGHYRPVIKIDKPYTQ